MASGAEALILLSSVSVPRKEELFQKRANLMSGPSQGGNVPEGTSWIRQRPDRSARMAGRDYRQPPCKLAAAIDVEARAQMRIFEHGCKSLVGKSQPKRKCGVIQRLAWRKRDSAGHIGE